MNQNWLNDQSESDGSESRFNPIHGRDAAHRMQNQADDEVRLKPSPNPGLQPQWVEITPQPLLKSKPPKWMGVLLALLILFVFFTPFRVTTLILGIDRPPKGTWIGRSDTMILTTLPPLLPQVSLLSIPRDLWVSIPSYNNYENRINTAHYFAELEAADSGMQAARQVVEQNFGIQVDYVVRLKFDGFVEVVDALGGVTVSLPRDMSGLTAGRHRLDGTQALKFVRDRAGSDDFFRQERGQLFISAAFKEILNPLKWVRLPAVVAAAFKAVETDLPFWLWPRTAYGFLFSAVSGFDAHSIDRNFITPWVTEDGAQVLLPNWELILPMTEEIFK